jgi:hypothetical protein
MTKIFADHWRVFLGLESDRAKVWRDHQRLRWLDRISTPFVLFPVLSVQLSLPLVVRVIGWTMVAVWTYCILRLTVWQCPRCKRRFFAMELPYRRGGRRGDLSERRCMNCGLLRP